MREPAPPGRCPPPEDLTAQAHGEGDDAERAALARHLLVCPGCRALHERDARLLLDLKALGAARASAAEATRGVPARRGGQRWLAWLPPAAAALLVALALALPRRPAPERGQPVPAPLGARVASMLAAQAPDGRWDAEHGPVGTVPEAATGLVLLALEREWAVVPGAGAVAAPFERGASWLASQVLDPARSRRLAQAGQGAQAVALAALSRAAARSPERAPEAAAEVLIGWLGRAASQGRTDPAARAWVEYALAQAEAADLSGAREARRELDGGERTVLPPEQPHSPAPQPPSAGVVDCSPVRLALETLRDEAPLRALALGPACRFPGATPGD